MKISRGGSQQRFDLDSWSEGFLQGLEPWTDPGEVRSNEFARYMTDPTGYAVEQLGLRPWSGVKEKGQAELFAGVAGRVWWYGAGGVVDLRHGGPCRPCLPCPAPAGR